MPLHRRAESSRLRHGGLGLRPFGGTAWDPVQMKNVPTQVWQLVWHLSHFRVSLLKYMPGWHSGRQPAPNELLEKQGRKLYRNTQILPQALVISPSRGLIQASV